MATATDDFNRADAGSLGANWTAGTGASNIGITSNAAKGVGVSDSHWFYNAVTFAADQYSEAKITTPTTQDNHALTCRSAVGGAKTFYYCDFGAVKVIGKFIAGTPTTLKSVTATVNANDVCRCEVVGFTIYYKINGAIVDSAVDGGSSIASGQPGLFFSTSDGVMDDWVGSDDLVTPAPALSANLSEASLPPSYF